MRKREGERKRRERESEKEGGRESYKEGERERERERKRQRQRCRIVVFILKRNDRCLHLLVILFNIIAKLYCCNSEDVPQIGAVGFALVVSVPNTCAIYRVILLFTVSFLFQICSSELFCLPF